ncbi:type IV secretion system protein TrbL [Oxalobacteraceae bacterium GrIS 1.11]
MKNTKSWMLVACLLLVASPAFAGPEYDLGSIMTQYQTAATQFGQNITAIALKLTYTLFTLDIAWLVLNRIFKNADTIEIGTAVIMRIMWIGLVVWIINNPSVPLAFVNSFIQIGKTGAGTSAISPGDVFWQGIDLVNLMMTKFSDSSTVMGVPVPAGIAAMSNPFAAILIGMALIIIVVCFAILAAQFAVAWVQLWFYLAVYPIVLAFGALTFTRDMAMKVITTPIVYGVRFMAIYFIIAVGTTLAATFGTEIANLSLTNLAPIWTVLAGSVLLLMLTLKVPTLASDLLGGTASLSAGDGVGAGLVAGGAIGAVAGGAYALGTGAANGVAGAIKAGQSAIGQAREKGASGVMATTAGAAGAIGSAVGEAAMGKVKGFGAQSPGGQLANRIDAKTANIREAKAAGNPAATVPGGQPAAPASPAGPPSLVPPAPSTDQPPVSAVTPPASTRETPPAPSDGASGGMTGPVLPVAEQATAMPSATSSAATPADSPSAPATNAPRGSISAPAAPTSSAASGGSSGTPGSHPASPAPAGSNIAADAAKQVLREMEKTGGAAGGSIQTHHGEV